MSNRSVRKRRHLQPPKPKKEYPVEDRRNPDHMKFVRAWLETALPHKLFVAN